MFKKNCFFLLILLCFVTVVFFVSESFSAQNKSCLKCHLGIKKVNKYIHPAVKIGCESCHMRIAGKEHPNERDSIILKTDIPDLCWDCHKKKDFNGNYIHKPMEDGTCTNCHYVHYSKHEYLLIEEAPGLCYHCHGKENFRKKYIHKVSIGGCGKKCHNPHASEYPKLLSMPIKDVCTGCHNKQESGSHIVSLPGGTPHPIVWERDPRNRKQGMTCTSCHCPHSSNYQKLFTYKRICKRCHRSY